MLARDYITILVIFSLFAGIGALMVLDLSSSESGYDNENITDSTFASSYNKLSNLTTTTNQMANSTRSSEGLSTLGSLDVLFTSTIAVIQLIFGSFSLVNSVFASFITSFGIPITLANLIFPALIALITIVIVFVVISSLTKTKI